MTDLLRRCNSRQFLLIAAFHAVGMGAVSQPAAAQQMSDQWISLFDGRSLEGWRAAEHPVTWRVSDGQLVASGDRSHLYYVGSVGNHDFRNFDLMAEVQAGPATNSGLFIHTQYQESGWPERGYQLQINNSHRGNAGFRELGRTGSLHPVRNIYKSFLHDDQWCYIRVTVIKNRVRVWINGLPTVDYLEPQPPDREGELARRRLSRGTIALQGHDRDSRVAFRNVKIRLLPDDADPQLAERASDRGYGCDPRVMDAIAADDVPVIDFHIHFRGGITPRKVLERQAVTGINAGVLRNVGKGWPIATDEQLREHLASVAGMPLFVGVQVNDRDWMHRHSPDLLAQLDYVLADTMIMPMPDDDSEPVRLWLDDQYEINDAAAWMERYMRHNLHVLAEPITILANPTYLPPAVEDKYNELWTDVRMRQVIQAAIDNHVALEINASSPWPHDRFIRMAKQMGAKFTFGSNNFDDQPIDMTRCLEAIARFGLTPDDMLVPEPRRIW